MSTAYETSVVGHIAADTDGAHVVVDIASNLSQAQPGGTTFGEGVARLLLLVNNTGGAHAPGDSPIIPAPSHGVEDVKMSTGFVEAWSSIGRSEGRHSRKAIGIHRSSSTFVWRGWPQPVTRWSDSRGMHCWRRQHTGLYRFRISSSELWTVCRSCSSIWVVKGTIPCSQSCRRASNSMGWKRELEVSQRCCKPTRLLVVLVCFVYAMAFT